MVSWFSRKQPSIALSTTKAEYIATCMADREAVWFRKLLVGLFGQRLEPTMIHYDNQSCVKLSVNPVYHDKTKHVEMKYHYVREMVQIMDVLTKPLG